MGANRLKVRIAVSKDSTRSQLIRVLSSEMISHFLTTNACLALVQHHALRSHVVKVTNEVGGSTEVRKCLQSERAK